MPFISGLYFAAVLLMSHVLADQTSFQRELNLFVCLSPAPRHEQSEAGRDSHPCLGEPPASQKLG